MHEGEKSHTCDICKKSFNMVGNLKQHIRIHSGDKPHKCNICEKAFTRADKLKNHKHTCELKEKNKMYHKTISVCDICQKETSNKSSLLKHKKAENALQNIVRFRVYRSIIKIFKFFNLKL